MIAQTLKGALRVGVILIAVMAVGVVVLAASIPFAMLSPVPTGPLGVRAEHVIISDVDVLTMADRQILPRQFVAIQDGRIASISDTPREGAADYFAIDGRGMTLMPGLIDMHAHIFDRSDLANYLAAGATTVRNMMGMPAHLRWRKEIASGELPGPSLITASPTFNSGEFAPFHVFPKNADEARKLVRRYHSCGYDFIKIYDGLSPEIFAAVMDEANETGIDVAGHLPRSLKLQEILSAGLVSIEHAEEIYSTLLTGDDADAQLDSIVEQIAASKTAMTPTLVAYRNLQRANADPEQFFASIDMDRINPVVQFFDHRAADDFIKNGKPDRIARKMRLMTDLTRRLYDRGANVLLGTDTGPAFTIAGASLHDEMALNADAGVDPYAILYSGTVASAAALNQSGEIGVIAPGARAELILVSGNPLADLSILRRPTGVLMNGHYYDRTALDELEKAGAKTSSAYATIGWLLWQQLTRGEVCRPRVG